MPKSNIIEPFGIRYLINGFFVYAFRDKSHEEYVPRKYNLNKYECIGLYATTSTIFIYLRIGVVCSLQYESGEWARFICWTVRSSGGGEKK